MRGGKLVPALCNLLGILILVFVILSCIPVTVPRFFGYEIFNVVSGSMEPEIPVGSLVYVESAPAKDILEGDVIAFQSGDSVITHRVMRNRNIEGEFVTKGDANETEDLNPVPHENLIGRVKYHFPMAGNLVVIYTSTMGKVYVICFAACGAMLNILAGRLRDRNRDEEAN